MNYMWHDLAGNIGVVFVLGTYLLLQLGKLKPETLSFSVANIIGAALIIVSLLVDFNMSAFIVEVAWFGISLVGVVFYFQRQRSAPIQE
jgi:hypothetical protein